MKSRKCTNEGAKGERNTTNKPKERITTNKMKLIIAVFLALNYVHPSEAALGIPEFLEYGTCNNASLFNNFEPTKYQGLWFDIQSVPNEYQLAKQCVNNNYTWLGERMICVGKGLNEEGQKVREIAEMRQEMEYVDEPNPAHMTVYAPGVPQSPYQIISTDYITFSCIHSCLDSYGFKAEFFWVLSRTPELPQIYVDHCHQAFINMGLNPDKLHTTSQGENCFYREKLDSLLQKNREFMDSLGLPRTASLPTLPTPLVTTTEYYYYYDIFADPAEKESKAASADKDETMLEEDIDSQNSAPSTYLSNNIIPLFILIAVLLPSIR